MKLTYKFPRTVRRRKAQTARKDEPHCGSKRALSQMTFLLAKNQGKVQVFCRAAAKRDGSLYGCVIHDVNDCDSRAFRDAQPRER